MLHVAGAGANVMSTDYFDNGGPPVPDFHGGDTNFKSIYYLSIPRDLYVPIPGHGENRINAALTRCDQVDHVGLGRRAVCALRQHHAVEQGEDMCPPIERLGPFATREEAEHALEKAEQRNQEWDNDPAWNDDSRGED